jgi:hypothetical protein
MSNPNLSLRDQVVSWLRMNDQTIASFDRIISNVGGAATYSQLYDLVRDNPSSFRSATIKGSKPGLVLLPGATVATPVDAPLQTGDVTAEVIVVVDPTTDPVVAMPLTEAVEAIGEQKTSLDYLKSLFKLAAETEVSGASVNYSQAALNLTTAMAIAKDKGIEL